MAHGLRPLMTGEPILLHYGAPPPLNPASPRMSKRTAAAPVAACPHARK